MPNQGFAPSLAPSLAARLLQTHWDGRLPVDLAGIARKAGLRLERKDAGYPFCGRFDRTTNVIEYNGLESLNRRRFTVAHELGHWALGHDDTPGDLPDMFRASTDSAIERDANLFAANLLIPSKAFRKIVNSGRIRSVDHLASAFQVSVAAVSFQFSSLGIV